MPDLLVELARLGHVARVGTLRARGIPDRIIAAAVRADVVARPRRGWIVSPLADREQLRAIAIGGRLGCTSALRRFGVWAGDDLDLHVHVPRTASRLRLDPVPDVSAAVGVWHPLVPSRRRDPRGPLLASDATSRVHWTPERSPRHALDWIVSPHTALAEAVRCLDAEHASAAIDSVIHERVLTRRQVDEVLAALPGTVSGLVDALTGRPESGPESLSVRRLVAHGFSVVPQVELAGFRYDGMIDGCVLFEVDGRGYHSGRDEFFTDRDRTMVGQALGMPVVRPSARHVLEDWPMVMATVTRVVEDARLLRAHRGLPVAPN